MDEREVIVTRDTSLDNRVRETIRMREKRLHDEASALGNARREGFEIGYMRGLAEVIAEKRAAGETDAAERIIDKIKSDGYSEDKIEEIIKLSEKIEQDEHYLEKLDRAEKQARMEEEARWRAEMIEKMRKDGISEERIQEIMNS